jgi:hypothetical protein
LRSALALLLTACASQGAPPGGPPDTAPPLLVRTTPDTSAVNVRPRRVTFRFDEVVAERPAGAPSLAALFVVSPRAGDPDVSWRREAITVRPRRGFQRNTVYTVTLLPGLADLRGNVRPDGAELVFSTGATIPRTRLSGVVFDWAAGQPAARAFVQAVQVGPGPGTRDTTTYVAVADSTGRFAFRHLPTGAYTVRGAVDANNNRSVDARELYDSTAVTLRDSLTIELLAFAHDTVGPRLSTVEITDSVTLRATFDKPLSPAQALSPALFTVTAPDSTRVPVTAVARPAADSTPADSAAPRARPAPSAVPLPRPGAGRPASRDTTPALPPPRPSRPSPTSVVTVRLGRPLRREATYRVRAVNARNLLGVARTSDRTVEFEKAPPAPAPPRSAPRPGARAPAPRPATGAASPRCRRSWSGRGSGGSRRGGRGGSSSTRCGRWSTRRATTRPRAPTRRRSGRRGSPPPWPSVDGRRSGRCSTPPASCCTRTSVARRSPTRHSPRSPTRRPASATSSTTWSAGSGARATRTACRCSRSSRAPRRRSS